MKKAIICAFVFVLHCLSVEAAPPTPCQTEIGTTTENFATFVQAKSDTNFHVKPGECLVSPNRNFMAVMQTAGNLVVYPVPGQSAKNHKWASSTIANEGASLLIQQDGHLVIYPKDGVVPDKEGKPQGRQDVKAPWVSGPAIQPFGDYFLAMQNDGNLVMYRGIGPDTSKGSVFDTFTDNTKRKKTAGGTSGAKTGCTCTNRCAYDKYGILWCNCVPDRGC